MQFLSAHGLTFFDAFVFVVLVLSVVTAFFRGFCKELFTLIAVISALILSSYLAHFLITPMESLIPQPTLANAAAKIVTFLLARIVLGLIGKLLARSTRTMISPPLDTLLGAVFGFARGFLLIFIPFFFAQLFLTPDNYPTWLAHSKTLPYLEKTTKVLKPYLPESYFTDHKKMNTVELHQTLAPEIQGGKELEKIENINRPEQKTYAPQDRRKMDNLVRDHQ